MTELEHKIHYLLHQNWYGALLYLQEQCQSKTIERAVRVTKPNVDFSQYSEQEILQALAVLLDDEENCTSFTINQTQRRKTRQRNFRTRKATNFWHDAEGRRSGHQNSEQCPASDN